MGYIFWCAACGNPDIIVESDKQGYSMKKGLAGAVVLGPVGAVAGLDGKETTSYYCPKCGARLKNPMPDYEVNTILQLLENPEASRLRIEEKLKKYPNMMLPKGWVAETPTESVNTQVYVSPQRVISKADFTGLTRILKTSTEANVSGKVYDFFLQYGCIPVMDVINYMDSLCDWQKESNPEYDLINYAIDDLMESYKIRTEKVHGEKVYVLATNKDEMKAWRWEASADKVPVDNYLNFVKDLVKSNQANNIRGIEQEIIKKEPNINDDNPYTALSLAKRACAEIDRKDGLVDFDGDQIKIRSTKLAEDDLRWEIEESWKESEVTSSTVGAYRAMAPVLKSKDMLSYGEITQRARSYTAQKIAALLKRLCDDGYCTKDVIGSKAYFSLKPEYKGWSITDFENYGKASTRKRFVDESKRNLALDKLKKKSGQSFWNILDEQLTDSRKTEEFYECFMIFELEGSALRKENSNEYIWEYIDKNAATREKLNNEKNRLEKEIADCEKVQEEQVNKINELKEELKNKVFDESEYTLKISDLEGTLSRLESKLSSLGLFSFREKKETNEQIATCKKDIEKTRRSLADAKRDFSSDISKKNASYDADINKYKNELSSKKKRLSDINEQLKKLN